MSELSVTFEEHVATVVIQRPPHNFIDVQMIRAIADELERIDQQVALRSVVLAAEGRSFCAGASFATSPSESPVLAAARDLYDQALRIFACRKPIVAAVQGAAIGGGLGLALAADFRVVSPAARFAANFTRLGYHPGFGLSVTLPDLVGRNQAELMFYTSRRIDGRAAVSMGLANELVEPERLRERATALAREIAECSPLGLLATRATMRAGLVERVRAATSHELEQQERLRTTSDFAEGVRSTAERRPGNFQGL